MLQKAASYSDFTDLYAKVMPALDSVQAQLTVVNDQNEQSKHMISRLDENMKLYALKHETVGFATELRKYCLKKV